MGNSGSINATHTDRPPDEIFQVCSRTLGRRVASAAGAAALALLLTGARAQIKVANAGNTCYMDAVLFSMFAMPSTLDAMLTKR